MQFKYFNLILPALFFSVESHAQNVPNNEHAPSGTIVNMATPAEITNVPDANYMKTYVPMIPITDAASVNSGSPASSVKQQLVFMDGFMKPYQSITRNVATINNQQKHLVQIFDNRVQRDAYSFLPFPADDGNFQAYAFLKQRAYYATKYPEEGYTAFSRSVNSSNTADERSGISYAPGKSQVGMGRGTKSKLEYNALNKIRLWDIDGAGLPVSTGYYAMAKLTATLIDMPSSDGIAGSNPQAISYMDGDGRLVAKLVADGSSTAYQSTYYVYDIKGNLVYTLPPKAFQYFQDNNPSAANWAGVVDKLCFRNIYDSKNRFAGTKKPGEDGYTLVVYDRKDRVVMRQSPNEYVDREWEITFYDKLGRVKATSVYKDAAGYTRDTWQQMIDNGGNNSNPADLIYYLSSDAGEAAYPYNGSPYNLTGMIAQNTMMSYNWYDSYKAEGLEEQWSSCVDRLHFTETSNAQGAEEPVRSKRVDGMATGSMVRVLRSPNALPENIGDWRVAVSFYDDKGRTIYSVSYTRDETTGAGAFNFDYSGTKYDFTGRPLLNKHATWKHCTASGQNGYDHTELTKYEYDGNSGSLVKTSHKVDGGAWAVLSKMSYDELGRAKRNDLGNGGEIQDFTYSIRGQLTGINGHYAESGDKEGLSRTFGESLKYDYGFGKPRYDGKMAGVIWRGAYASDKYAYGYDYTRSLLLQKADFSHMHNYEPWNRTVLDYSVSDLSYDKNGNIMSMKQRGVSPSGPVDMDVLSYSYQDQSNRLAAVTDQGTEISGTPDFKNGAHNGSDYDYYRDGSLKYDQNRNIDRFDYTRFGKPVMITKKDGSTIEYSYDAAGNKLEEIIIDKTTGAYKRTDYIGNAVYQHTSPDNVPEDKLQYLLTGVGRTVFDDQSASPVREEFFVKDHLGNVRSTINTYTYSTKNYLASFELASAHLENLVFDGIESVRDYKPGGGGDNTMAANLNGADEKRRVGTSLMVHVMAGDKVSMNVNTFYESYDAQQDAPVSADDALKSLISTLTGGAGGFAGSESHNTDLVEKVFSPGNFKQLNELTSETTPKAYGPKAYLNYVLFDEKMQIVQSMTGAFQANGEGAWSTIGTQSALEVPQNGYLAIYLINNSTHVNCFSCADVYFDQLNFTVTKGTLLEETHYYPFGLPITGISSHTADEFKENRRKYQGNEFVQDLGLNLMDFQARQYDPQIGRFLSVDPLAADGGQEMYSPYAAMGNMPESMIDPEGLQYGPGNTYCKPAETGTGSYGGTGSSASGKPGNPIWGSGGGILDRNNLAAGAGFGPMVQLIIFRAQQNKAWNDILSGTGFQVNANGKTVKSGGTFLNDDWTWDGNGMLLDDVRANTGGSGIKKLWASIKKKVVSVLEAGDRWSHGVGDSWGNPMEGSSAGQAYGDMNYALKKKAGTDRYEGADGFKKYGKPTMMKTVAVLGTVVSGGAFSAFAGTAAWSTNITIWNGASLTVGVYNTTDALLNNELPASKYMNNKVGLLIDAGDALQGSPFGLFNMGVRYYEWSNEK